MRYFPGAAGRPALRDPALRRSRPSVVGGSPSRWPTPTTATTSRTSSSDVQAQIEQAQEEAEEASKAVTEAKAALADAEAQLVTAQANLASRRRRTPPTSQAQLAGRRRPQDAADAGRARRSPRPTSTQAKADVVAGQAALDAQQAIVKDTVVSIYQQGSPELLAWTGYLESRDPGRPDPQDGVRRHRWSRTRTPLFDAAARRRGRCCGDRRTRSRRPRRQADEQADLAAQHLVNVAATSRTRPTDAANAALLAQNAVTLTVAAREKAQRKAERARRQDLEELAKLKKQEEQDQAADPRRGRRRPQHRLRRRTTTAS